jgi:hypothetical protein
MRILGGSQRVLVGVPNGHHGRWMQICRYLPMKKWRGNVFDAIISAEV